ncbi:MAG: HAD family hydrolase [Tannerella sp.]|jgi:phosphoglycolate phosphatase|nr:HAD family hydrolase [Tannerella sp.]
MRNLKLAIFDLDGTLLDTISDLAHSTNYALEKNGFPSHPVEAYKYFVGNGINKLFERALPENQKTDRNIARIRDLFLLYYDQHNTDYTRPYEGIPYLLKILQSKNLMIAVASNKYQKATEKLIKHIFPDVLFTAVLGQREGIPVKPDPAIVYDILKIANTLPEETVYIGDSGVDMQTASNCGIVSIGVTWGFRSREELETAGANHIADSANEILEIINC